MLDWIKGNGSRKRRDFGNFKFILKSQPEIIDSSSTISLIAYSNGFGNAVIPCVYRWSIIKNGMKVSRPQFKGTTFKCEPSDVGGVIEAEVESTDMEYGGTAIVQFNPVQMDPNIQPQVQQSLIEGNFSTTVHAIRGIEQRQCQIRISEKSIKINHNYSQASLQFEYSANQPQTQCLVKSSAGMVVNFIGDFRHQVVRFVTAIFDYPFKGTKRGLVMKAATSVDNDLENRNGAKCIELKFPSHNQRDIFLFVWKALAANKQQKQPLLSSSSIISSNQIPINTTIMGNNNLNLLRSQIQSLKSQLFSMSQLKKQHQIQKYQNFYQIQRLKQQIKTIIKNYTTFIEQRFQQKTQYRNNSVIVIDGDNSSRKRYKTLVNQNNHLNNRIYALTKQIDTIRFQPLTIQSMGQQQNTVKSINCSPFWKKRTTDQSKDIYNNLLQDCDVSRISYLSEISSINGNTRIVQQHQISVNDTVKGQLELRLQRSCERINQLQSELSRVKRSQSVYQSNNSLSIIKTEKKQPCFDDVMMSTVKLQWSNQQLLSQKQMLIKRIDVLVQQNRLLMQEKQRLTKAQGMLQGKLKCMQEEILIYQKNLDSLNRSQQFSIDSHSFNNQQIEILKKQNDFLTNQNEKLTKACQKYMAEAKQSNKLRLQLTKIKSKVISEKFC